MPEITIALLYELIILNNKEISLLRKEITELKEIIRLLKPHPHTTTLFLNFKKTNMQTIKIGDLLEGTLELDDNVTGLAVADATFSGDEVTSSDDSIATVMVNADDASKIDVTAIAVGTFTVHVKTTASYTDSNGNPASGSFEADSIELTVGKDADGVTLKVNFPAAA